MAVITFCVPSHLLGKDLSSDYTMYYVFQWTCYIALSLSLFIPCSLQKYYNFLLLVGAGEISESGRRSALKL
jgi:hypothetical protein